MFKCSNVMWVSALAISLTGAGIAMAEDAPATQPARKHVLGGPKAGQDGPPRGPMGERGPAGPGMVLVGALRNAEISPESREAIKPLMEKFGEDMKAHREASKDAAEAAFKKLEEARKNKDRDAAEAARKELDAIRATAPKIEPVIEAIKAKLTAEEKARFETSLKEAREKMEQRRTEMREKARNGAGEPGAKKDGPRRRPPADAPANPQ